LPAIFTIIINAILGFANLMRNAINFLYVFCVFMCFSTFAAAQTNKPFVIPDSLKRMSFEELEKRFENSILDKKKRAIYANTYFKKSKNQNKSSIIVNGMYLKAFLFNDERESLKYVDSIIEMTKNSNDFQYPAKAYILKSRMLYTNDKLGEALKAVLLAQKNAENNNNIGQIVSIKQLIGLLKIELGRPDEALPLVLENYNYYIGKKDNSVDFIYTSWILSEIYNALKKPDIALKYINHFLNRLDKSNSYYKYFVLNKGISNRLKKDFMKSNVLLDEAICLIRKSDDPINLAMAYYYRGENELSYNYNQNKAKFYFDKVDSILVSTNKNSYNLRSNYIRLIEISKNDNDNKKHLYYLNRLIEIDEFLNENNVKLSENIIKKYDTPQLLIEKEKVIDEIKREKYFY